MSAVTVTRGPRLVSLSAYLLRTLPVPDAVAIQRRLAYEVSGDPSTGAVLLCDHPPGVVVGRHGSRAEVLPADEELAAREWPVRWLAVGGGAMLHAAGQVACYPILPLAPFGLTPAGYVTELLRITAGAVASSGCTPAVDPAVPAVRVAGRRVCHFGVSVRNGVTAGGVVLNVSPDLSLFRCLRPAGERRPMTSLQRECPGAVRPAAVRQRLLEALEARFATRLSILTSVPWPPARPTHAHAAAAR